MSFLFCALLVTGSIADDEHAVMSAALHSYFNQMHGGTGIAFPEARRPVLLKRETIAPSRTKLRVRVASPANRAAALRYGTSGTEVLVERLRIRSASAMALHSAPREFALGESEVGACGPAYDAAKFADAVALSRVAFDGRKHALVYVEHAGGARAYHARRGSEGWEIDWYVELWACG